MRAGGGVLVGCRGCCCLVADVAEFACVALCQSPGAVPFVGAAEFVVCG